MIVIIEAIGSEEFLAGLRWGGITAAVGLLFGLAWRKWRHDLAPVTGIAALVAATMAMPIVRSIDGELLAGLALLAAAGALFHWTRRVPLLPVLVAVPGAWQTARSELPGPAWVVPLMIVVIAVAGPVISWFDQNADGSAIPAVLFAVSASGVWATVPDTEEALVLLGAMAIPTFLAWPLRIVVLGSIGGHALVGLYMWVVAWGGRGRDGSIVGAAAALGMLLAAPIAAGLARRKGVNTSGWLGVGLVVLHLVVVAFTTRIAGLRDSSIDAAIFAAPTLLAALLLWVGVERAADQGAASAVNEAPSADPR